MPAADSIAVALIDDEQAIRKGLGLLISSTPGYRCVGTFSSVEEALPSLGRDLPDVLLLDINLPGISGSEGARVLHEKYPSLLILMLTVYDEDAYIFESMCNGASGYLLKRTPPGDPLAAGQEPDGSFKPNVPKTWDDTAIATLEVRLANPIGSPKHVSADYYYRIPVAPIYKSYPVYPPGHGPSGYLD